MSLSIPQNSIRSCWFLFSFIVTACSSTLGISETDREQATVSIVQFGDYQCGPCAAFGRRLHQLLKNEATKINFEFRHCPAKHHEVGRKASLVAVAAEMEGRFWELHWQLVEDGPIQTEKDLRSAVQQLGFDEQRLREIIETGHPSARVDRDLAMADKLAVRGTPTTFINNRKIEGNVSLYTLVREITREYRRRSISPDPSNARLDAHTLTPPY